MGTCHSGFDPCSHLQTHPSLAQAVSSSACNESLFGYTQLDGRNATGYQCPEECKALWEVGAVLCAESLSLPGCVSCLTQRLLGVRLRTSRVGWRNATKLCAPSFVQKWSPSCYGLLSYAVDTLYSDASLANTYFRRQSDGTFWNLAGVSNWTACVLADAVGRF